MTSQQLSRIGSWNERKTEKSERRTENREQSRDAKIVSGKTRNVNIGRLIELKSASDTGI